MGYVLLYGFCRLLAFLPLNLLYFLSDVFLYPLVYYVAAYRKKVVRVNLAASFPEKSPEELRKLEKRFYRYFCALILETIYLSGISGKEALRRTTFTNTGILENCQAKGQQVLIMLGHYGNWEYQSFLNLHCPGLHQINVYRPLRSKAFDRLMLKLRTRFGAEMVEKQAVLRKIALLRRAGQSAVFGMIADQSPSKANLHYWTRFLNQDTAVLNGVERLARSSGAAVVYADVRILKRGYYSTEFKLITDKPGETADNEITEEYSRLMEQSILREPAFWLWTHRRWKHRRNQSPKTAQKNANKQFRK
ncbi:MAG: lysophospholipid acyltransferase family protein [Bacteroidales bacterium]|jgi:KDO2-lipid IV(A) lauroyltransferase